MELVLGPDWLFEKSVICPICRKYRSWDPRELCEECEWVRSLADPRKSLSLDEYEIAIERMEATLFILEPWLTSGLIEFPPLLPAKHYLTIN